MHFHGNGLTHWNSNTYVNRQHFGEEFPPLLTLYFPGKGHVVGSKFLDPNAFGTVDEDVEKLIEDEERDEHGPVKVEHYAVVRRRFLKFRGVEGTADQVERQGRAYE